MILALIGAALAADVTLPAGVHEIDGREVYSPGFTIDAKAGAHEHCRDQSQELPTADEWHLAAQQKGFKPSGAFERLADPADAACDIRMDVVEAEGVGGHLYFAGWGQHQGEAEVLAGKGSVTQGHVRIHSNAWHFWGDEAKPAPLAERCIQREVTELVKKKVLASSLNIRTRRDLTSDKVHNVGMATEVVVHWVQGDWAWVTAPKSVFDDSGTEPTTHRCTETGWTLEKYLVDELPSLQSMMTQAEAHLAAGRLSDALPLAERAAAWHDGNPALREQLATVYERVESTHAARVRGEAKALRADMRIIPWGPDVTAVKVATWCDGDPAKLPWKTLQDAPAGQACIVPWTEVHYQDRPGWIDLDPVDLGSQCGDGGTTQVSKRAMVTPETLHLKIAAGTEARGVHLRARSMQGQNMDGEFNETGWGPWRTLSIAEIGAQDAYLTAPMKAVVDDAGHQVEVGIEVYSLGDAGKPLWSGAVALIWPVSC